jgi:hypothetical protein
MFLNAGEAPPLVKDDTNDPHWVAEDIVRHSLGEIAQFWFEFPQENAPGVIMNLKAAGAAARLDGSDQIVLVSCPLEKTFELATLCLQAQGVYLSRLSRV